MVVGRQGCITHKYGKITLWKFILSHFKMHRQLNQGAYCL